MRNIIVGTRQSELALAQSHLVIEALSALQLPYTFEIKKILTKGDKFLSVSLSKIGGKGLFVKEIEQALLDGEIDIAVHSMKDVPGVFPDDLTMGAVLKRHDVRDALISKLGYPFETLPQGAIIGTSSLRRASQLLAARPDLVVQPIRGNIHTRIRKMEEENFDAIVLAAAGLERMNWMSKATSFFDPADMVPAVGQGAIGIQCRSGDGELLPLLRQVNDCETEITVTAERAFLKILQGGCQVPIAAYAEIDEHRTIKLSGLVASSDGSRVIRSELSGTDAEAVGTMLAKELIKRGAATLLADALRFEEL